MDTPNFKRVIEECIFEDEKNRIRTLPFVRFSDVPFRDAFAMTVLPQLLAKYEPELAVIEAINMFHLYVHERKLRLQEQSGEYVE